MNRMEHLLNPITNTPTYLEMTQTFDFTNHSHRRHNPLSDTYVLCSPHRAKRPWQGAREEVKKMQLPEYDPKCYLCPGNVRATGDSNPKYDSTFIFQNDYPAVIDDQPDFVDRNESDSLSGRLLKTEGVKVQVINSWHSLYKDCQQKVIDGSANYKYLQIFENKGFAMGCSNPHPHGQGWCLDVVPTEVEQELKNMKKYLKKYNSHLLGDYVKLEMQQKERIVVENESFLVVVPYWALWPFETLVIAKTHLKSTKDFNEDHKKDLADALKQLTTKYDNLFNTSFPYSMGIHQAPLQCSHEDSEASWFHMHFYPPLLRSATVKKFCVGFEMLGEAQRDLTSEQAAARLQELDGSVHFTNK